MENKYNQLLKLDEVARRTSLSCSSIYRYMAKGEFPKQVYLSDSRVAWREDEVSSWISERGIYPHIINLKTKKEA